MQKHFQTNSSDRQISDGQNNGSAQACRLHVGHFCKGDQDCFNSALLDPKQTSLKAPSVASSDSAKPVFSTSDAEQKFCSHTSIFFVDEPSGEQTKVTPDMLDHTLLQILAAC